MASKDEWLRVIGFVGGWQAIACWSAAMTALAAAAACYCIVFRVLSRLHVADGCQKTA